MLLSSASLNVTGQDDSAKPGFQESVILDSETLFKENCFSAVDENLLDALKAPEYKPNDEKDAPLDESTATEAVVETMQVDDFNPKADDKDTDTGDKVTKMEGFPILVNILDTKLPVDTVISCSDGKIGAHRIVLAAASPFLGTLFDDQKLGEVAVLILPDIKKSTMETLLHLAYTGKMIFSPEREEEVYAALECLLFGQMAKLELSLVTLKATEPDSSTASGSSRSVGSYSANAAVQKDSGTTTATQGSNNTRKRRLSDSFESRGRKQLKKLKFDKDGKQLPIAIRAGVPIGKDGARRLRKKEQNRILRDGNCIIHPPRLISDRETGTITLNPRRLPITSVRLRQLSDFVCIEFHQNNQPAWMVKKENEEIEEKQEDNNVPLNPEDIRISNNNDLAINNKEQIETIDASPTPCNTDIDVGNAELPEHNNFDDADTQLITSQEMEGDTENGSDHPSSIAESEDRESGFADHEHENDLSVSEPLHVDADQEFHPEAPGKIFEQTSPASVTCSDSERMDLLGKGVLQMDADTIGDLN